MNRYVDAGVYDAVSSGVKAIISDALKKIYNGDILMGAGMLEQLINPRVKPAWKVGQKVYTCYAGVIFVDPCKIDEIEDGFALISMPSGMCAKVSLKNLYSSFNEAVEAVRKEME